MTLLPHHYVSIVDGPRRAFLAGPYASHEAARAQIHRVRLLAVEANPWAHFCGFGTAASDAEVRTTFGPIGEAAE